MRARGDEAPRRGNGWEHSERGPGNAVGHSSSSHESNDRVPWSAQRRQTSSFMKPASDGAQSRATVRTRYGVPGKKRPLAE